MQQKRLTVEERADVRGLLIRSKPFTAMTEEELSRLVDRTIRYDLSEGEVAFCEGSPAQRSLVVAEGAVAGVRYTENGDEKLFRCFKRGDIIGLTAMFLPEARYLLTARIMRPTRVYGLPREVLQEVAEVNSCFAARMLEYTSMRLRTSLNQVDFFTGSSAEQRVAAFLLQLHEEQSSERIELPFRQKQVAVLLGVREETVSRVLSQFRKAGVLAPGRGPIDLIDVDFLRDLVGGQREHLRIGSF